MTQRSLDKVKINTFLLFFVNYWYDNIVITQIKLVREYIPQFIKYINVYIKSSIMYYSMHLS